MFFLDWYLPHSVQLFQSCFLCWCPNLFHPFSSIISSMMLSERRYWWQSWIHPGPLTHLFSTLSYSPNKEHMYWWMRPMLCFSMLADKYACTGNTILLIRASIRKKSYVFLPFPLIVLLISLKSPMKYELLCLICKCKSINIVHTLKELISDKTKLVNWRGIKRKQWI